MRLIVFILLFSFSWTSSAKAERHALVIGNANYASLEDLTNTHSDARAYHRALTEIGFASTLKLDLDHDAFLDELDALLARIKPGDEVAIVFSGHGWSDGGTNYLLPVDAPKLGSVRQLRRDSIVLSDGQSGLLDELKSAGVSLSVAIVDACRNNPFTPLPGKKSAGLRRGLSPITAPHGTFVIFSAGSGEEALDRLPNDPPDQRLSVFSRYFIPLLTSDLYLEDAIAVAQKRTYEVALNYNGHQQRPSYYDETLGKTCLKGNCNSKSEAQASEPQPADQKAFLSAAKAGSAEALEAFLTEYPESYLKPTAEAQLARLLGEGEQSVVTRTEFTITNPYGAKLRGSASWLSDPIDLLSKGLVVSVVETSGEWFKISRNGNHKEGWLHFSSLDRLMPEAGDDTQGQNLTTSKPSDSAGQNAGFVITNAYGARLRGDASFLSSPVGLLEPGEIVSVVETSGEWVRISGNASHNGGWLNIASLGKL
nr:caspase family protein [uncultured Roseibium sp.]